MTDKQESKWFRKKRTGITILLLLGAIVLFPLVFQSIVAVAEDEFKEEGSVVHAFYPSFAVYSEQIQKYIDEVDSLSFAWSRIDVSNPGELNTVRGKNGNQSFYYPKDYMTPIKYAKETNKPIQLNIYMGGSDCNKLLPYPDLRELMIQAIVDSMTKDITEGEQIYYDGVVIDFEGLRDTDGKKNPILYEGLPISTYFTQFLTDLRTEFDMLGKKLYVAVNPRLYFDGFDYTQILRIADRIILMAHDYEPVEKLTKNQVQQYTGYNSMNPSYSMAPILMIRKALNDIQSAASNKEELSKVWLQICFDSAQWKYDVNGPEGWETLEPSSLSRQGRGTPLYKFIKDRVDNTDGYAENLTYGYNNELQTPYIQFYNKSDKSWNVVLYEDSNSLLAKINLAKGYGLGGISIWSLYNVPDYNDSTGKKYYLDGWTTILEEMRNFHILTADSNKNVSFTDIAVEQAVRDKLGKVSGDITKRDVLDIYRLKLPNGVKSLKDLSQFENLEYLDASNLSLKDITPIKNLTSLRSLYLQRNEIADISPIKKLKDLEIVSLNGNLLETIDSLSGLTGLRELYLRENRIADITPLNKLTKLNVLEIGGNKIKKADAISNLKKLQKLSMDNNEISNIKGLKGLTALRSLNLSNNKISDLQHLEKLTKLEVLHLQRNSISDLTHLSGMKKLKELSLNGNKVSDLKPLGKLTSIEKLYLKENKIKTITSLKGLKLLKELYLSENQITDFAPVSELYAQLNGKCDFIVE